MTTNPQPEPVNPCTHGASFCGQHGYDCPPSAPADRAAILREAADALVAVAGQHPEARAVVIHWGDAAALLRTMAQEECDELEAQAHLDQLADELPRMADEAQQAETGAHPPRTEYIVERALGGGDWVVESITPAPERSQAEARLDRLAAAWPQPTYRIVRRLITSFVEYVRDPAVVSQPGKEA